MSNVAISHWLGHWLLQAVKSVTFYRDKLVTFIRVNRLLVRDTSCHEPEPNFIVTEISGQNIIWQWRNYRQHWAQRKPPVFNLLRGRFWGFSPPSVNDSGIGPPKLKFLLRFDQNVEYKRPAGAYPLCDFHNICRVCTPLQDALAVEIS